MATTVITRKSLAKVLVLVLTISAVLTYGIVANGFIGRADASPVVENWWPVDGVKVSGTQPFKAILKDRSINTYNMFWQVDTGQYNSMYDSWVDYPHKEAIVNLTGWNWKGAGPYRITFIAQEKTGAEIAKKSIDIYINQPISSLTPSPSTTPTEPAPTNSLPGSTTGNTSNSLAGLTFYVDPNSNAKRQADLWRIARPDDARQMDKIAATSQGAWFGDWNANIYSDVKNLVDRASSAGATPVMVAYNIPMRDCGGYSGGGANSPDAYRSWINSYASAIGSRKAVIILEPDAIAKMDCLNSTAQNTRYELVKYAVDTFKSKGSIRVYIDAGHARWVNASEMSNRLKRAGIANASGFAINVSNFVGNSESITYGNAVASATGKHYVIDTSRNGLGTNGEWCNPSGRALGTRSTSSTGNSLVDAFLWIKAPGESDGNCNGGPSAGIWWADYALGLAQRASF